MDTSNKINLTDLQLRNLAEHIPPKETFNLGLSLGLTKSDLWDMGQGISKEDLVGRTFQVLVHWRTNLDPFLIRWRSNVEGKQAEVVKLESALRENGLEKFVPCIDAHVTRGDNNSEDALPVVNLSLPHGAQDADRKQEIDIKTVLNCSNEETIQKHKARMHRLISNPTESDQSWSRIRHLQSVFRPFARLTNIEMPLSRFTVGVFSLEGLNQLKGNIENGQLGERVQRVLCLMGDDCEEEEEGLNGCHGEQLHLILELDSESYSNGVHFFKDLDHADPAASLDDEGILPGTAQYLATNDFSPWTTDRKLESGSDIFVPDSQQKGVNLLWRNVSQHNFGF